MIAVEMFIPVASNQGEMFTREHDLVFETYLVQVFGGLSRLPGTVEGSWIEGGAVYHDRNRVYMVAVKGITEGDKIREAVEFAKTHYEQLAICVRYLGQVEVL